MAEISDGWSIAGPDTEGHKWLVRASDGKMIVASTDSSVWAGQINDFEFYDKLVESQKPYNTPA